jgi:Spy/CpxP family protein refolding chaperone
MKWHYLLLLFTAIFIIIFLNKFSDLSASRSTPVFDKVNSAAIVSQQESPSESVNKNSPSNLIQQLNLTKEQKQQIEAIRRRYHQKIVLRKKDIDTVQQQLSQMMAGSNSISEIRAKNRELMTLDREIGDLRFESMLATREILTIEQRQKFVNMVRAKSSSRIDN